MDQRTFEKGSSIFNYGLIVMTLTHTLTHVFQRIHLALFPIIKQEFSLSLQELGLVAAIPYMVQVLLAIPTGMLSDRFGSKKLLIVSLITAAGGALLASQSNTPIILIVAVCLVYANTVIYHPASYSFTTRLFKIKDRPKALGIHGAGGTFGMALGPISVSILIGLFAFGWRQVYLFWLLPIFIGLILVLRIKSEPKEDFQEPKKEPSTSEKQGLDKGSLVTMNLIIFLAFVSIRMLAGQMVETFFTVYMTEERKVDSVLSSLVYGGGTLTGLIAAPVGGVMASKMGDKKWVLISLALAYASLGAATFVPNILLFAVFYLIYGFCNTLAMAANSSIVATLSPSRQRGLGYAIYFLPGEIMGVIAPVVASLIAVAFGLTSIFIASLAIFAVGLAVLRFGVKI
ncbi:MFS transporter [Candidatus Bathyarchaeota archaeon]|nr:MFS transporter [Candidatus Bathyarchaeota archaeon]MBS7630494.1 MFS transporter [Candidatus Bathyarchaeota archaeon]